MKVYLHLIFLIILLNLFSCKEPSKETKIVETKKKTEIKKADSISTNLVTNKKKTASQKHFEYYFVSAKSGLNYWNKPKVKILGKFPLNTRLKVIEYSNILDQITDNGKVLKGEWLGIENGIDTVYVFNAFLSSNYTYSDIKIYRASPFDKINDKKIRTGFLNLSESYFNNEYSENSMLSNNEQRKKFLNRINVSELDSVYIYDINSESISSYKVNDLPVITRENIYEVGYEIGFDLGNNYTGNYYNFAYIGKENPFQKGKLKPIIWSKDKKENFLEVRNLNNQKAKLNVSDFYKYQTPKTIYYSNGRRFISIKKDNNKIVFDKILDGGEGWDVNPLNSVNNNETIYQFEGELFKNKAPILFGLTYTSFGCSYIYFMNEFEPAIKILCDNRH